MLRLWRDQYLIEQVWGRQFIVWYYNNGEKFAEMASRYPALKKLAKLVISAIAKAVTHKLNRGAE